MKKLLLMLAFVALGAASYGQDFLGIKPSGSKAVTVNQFKAKGFWVVSDETSMITSMKGPLNGQTIELNIVYTPITKTVCRFSIYMPEQSSFYNLKREYEKYVDVFTTKYGTATNKYAFFKDPYYDGDGYEMQALTNDKATFTTYWFFDNINLAVEMSKYKQINIVYENQANIDLKNAEVKQLNTNAF
jgi:hypothetical protein